MEAFSPRAEFPTLKAVSLTVKEFREIREAFRVRNDLERFLSWMKGKLLVITSEWN